MGKGETYKFFVEKLSILIIWYYLPVFDTLILMNRAKDKATDRCRGDL